MKPPKETAPPALVIHRRGGEPESVHRGWIVCLENGDEKSVGDPGLPVFTRSCTKPFQALACLLSGAADRFGLTPPELALACASHNGSPEHRELALKILARGGLDESQLKCGASEPYGDTERIEYLQKSGRPLAGIHNCSGKHAAFLLTQIHLGGDPARYLELDSPLQKLVRELVGEALSVSPDQLGEFVDGCSAPTFHLPLRALALGFARLANPSMAPARIAPALERLRDAITAWPMFHSGRGRLCEAIVTSSRGRVIPKNGAEGVYAFGVRGRNAGFAIKIEDGSSRGYESIVVNTLIKRGFVEESDASTLRKFADPNLYNAAGLVIGREEIVAGVY